jgi:SAM-dependent methyltransferase
LPRRRADYHPIIRQIPNTDRYEIDSAHTLSIVVAEYQLGEILAARRYMKGRLLDVGCGTRRYARLYDPIVTDSIGTEVLASPHGIGQADVICQAEDLPFAGGRFDTVLMTEVLEHTRNPLAAFAECVRVLHAEGHLILSAPFVYPLHEWPHDYWRFTRYGLAALCDLYGLAPLYIHAKGGVGATLVSLLTQVLSRVTDGATRLLGLKTPLRDRAGIRWLLLMPSRVYLFLARRVKLPTTIEEKAEWMTPGFFMVARHGGGGRTACLKPGDRPAA